ncbi:MAG: TetR/AcrR family transcriptional regulator [Actinomycetota bacterium]
MLRQAELSQDLLPPRADSNGTLRRIYEAALVLLAERGYHGTSVREIADACGIKASSIYAHLPSKERLLHDLALLGHEEHRDVMRDAVLGAGAEPAEQLKALVAAHVRFHATYPVLATVANNELHALSPASAAEIVEIREDDIRTIQEVIERGVRLGRFSCRDSFLATAVIGAMGIRLATWYPARGGYDVDEIVAEFTDFALKMVSGSESSDGGEA